MNDLSKELSNMVEKLVSEGYEKEEILKKADEIFNKYNSIKKAWGELNDNCTNLRKGR